MTETTDWTDELPGLLRALLLPAGVAAIGGAATAPGVAEWYPTLRKPAFTPPSWLFGPVWSLLFLLMGIADHLVARSGVERQEVIAARRWYKLQLGLNALWSVLFFGRRSPLAALVEIVALWGAIVQTVNAFAKVSRLAALLLLPYLLWTSFAAILNAAIWKLNR